LEARIKAARRELWRIIRDLGSGIHLFEIANVLVRFDHVALIIVHANHRERSINLMGLRSHWRTPQNLANLHLNLPGK